MTKVQIKPMSVNNAWKGKRFKSTDYTAYETQVFFSLPRDLEIPKGNLGIEFEFGLSNANADLDNPVKPFLDILQKKYGFNDSRIYEMQVKKSIVTKGKEYTQFNIYSI